MATVAIVKEVTNESVNPTTPTMYPAFTSRVTVEFIESDMKEKHTISLLMPNDVSNYTIYTTLKDIILLTTFVYVRVQSLVNNVAKVDKQFTAVTYMAC